MNRLQVLTHIKTILATGAGQPDKRQAICSAIESLIRQKNLRGQSREAARHIQDEVMDYLKPHLTFRAKLKTTRTTDQIQLARHTYIDNLIKKEAT